MTEITGRHNQIPFRSDVTSNGDAALIARTLRGALSSSTSSLDSSIPSSSSKMTNGDAALMATAFREALKSSLSSSKVDDGPMESKQSSLTQTSQQSRQLPNDVSVIQTTTPTIINGDDDNDLKTVETNKRLDPTPITQPLPLTSNTLFPRPNHPLFESVNVPGDFPLDEPSTSSSVQSPPIKSPTRTLPDSNSTSPRDNNAHNREARRKPSSSNSHSFLLALAAP